MNPWDFVSGKKGESTTEKKKSFHKNEVISCFWLSQWRCWQTWKVDLCCGTMFGAWELTTSTITVSWTGGFLWYWEMKFFKVWIAITSKGLRGKLSGMAHCCISFWQLKYLGSVVTALHGLVRKPSGGKFMTSSSRETNSWGEFPTCK